MRLDKRDFVVLAGLVLAVTGVGFIYWPAALVVAGLLLIYTGARGR